jgi:hypothetical protein
MRSKTIAAVFITAVLLSGCGGNSANLDAIKAAEDKQNKITQSISEACGYWSTSVKSGTGLMSSQAATKFGALADLDPKYEIQSKAAYKLFIISESTKQGLKSESMAAEARENTAILLALCG